jgi:uncharacterized membrane protein
MPSKTRQSSPTIEKTQQHPSLERLVFFSDAVFAIAITLLALEIRLPETETLFDDEQLATFLAGNWHAYLAYALSFLVIGSFWTSHHRKFRFIRSLDGTLIFLNLLYLMVIAFMPFPSSVISIYANRTSTIFYASIMTLASLILALLWGYASHKKGLVDERLGKAQRRRQLLAPLMMAAVFGCSIVLAIFAPGIARLLWVLILLVTIYANRMISL